MDCEVQLLVMKMAQKGRTRESFIATKRKRKHVLTIAVRKKMQGLYNSSEVQKLRHLQ